MCCFYLDYLVIWSAHFISSHHVSKEEESVFDDYVAISMKATPQLTFLKVN